MPLPFDATLKELVARHLADFAALLHLPGPPAGVLNVDLSTVSAATDVAVGFGEPLERIADLNFQASRDANLPRRLWLYNALLHHRYRVPVHSAVLLLRPAADGPELTGRLSFQAFPRRGRSDFRYEVVRLWQQPVRRLLRAGPGALPLAVLGRLPAGVPTDEGLAGVVREVERRLLDRVPEEEIRRSLTAAYVLCGLRVDVDVARQVFQRGLPMRESVTYMAMIEEGELAGMRKTLLWVGRDRFGPPDETTRAAIESITDPSRLERMANRLLHVSTWADLLATP